ncbi:hypothetical protein B0T16DRAFT_416775 [Cercophora newfieldiana]|uniref:FAD dependent oxidoreductase domain-containing protein n=1 Tax=Cercophora newfieldiana TaxID=92897 RepID=A0AA39Y0R6_9PEZI|nr:hypothetical protein B0T16DRAFT_416775 [Cercophora newfieldiana]
MTTIVVLGAGVSGLTCALQLAKRGDVAITIVAKHMPGDYDVEYTSPWAGANVLPMAVEKDSRWEKRTWPILKHLAKEVPEAGIHLQKARVYRLAKDEPTDFKGPLDDSLFATDPWYQKLMDDFRELPANELPHAGVRSGCEFQSVCINTAIYLPWLLGQCVKYGVVFKRAVVSHISEAANMSHTGKKADIVINASGVLASRLGGVMDATVQPARGQIVVVRNEAPNNMMTTSGCDDSDDEIVYSMTRAAGGGTVLGGTYQLGNWDPNPEPNVAVRIMKRAIELHPELTGGRGIEALSIIRHGVGLRPYRKDGVRIEKERIDGTWVVHNYGHAGWGYQGSYGCAEAVVDLVDEAIAEMKPAKRQSKL